MQTLQSDKFMALAREGENTRIEYKTCAEEISESLYTKNPLLVRVFHELHWAEDLGSGTRNILRYAPLYYPDYKIEINSSSQFIFSITYQDENVQDNSKNVQENVPNTGQMSPTEAKNVPNTGQMSPTEAPKLTDEELSLKPFEREIVISKRKRRQQAIVGMISIDSRVSVETMAERLDVDKKTIKRDLKELKDNLVIERLGGTFGGEWIVLKKKK